MSQVSEIIVHWTPETSGRVASIQIQSRIAGTPEWTEQSANFDPAVGEFRFTANAPATEVEVRTRYRMVEGVFGAWTSGNIITAPAVVEYDTITGLPTKLADLNPAEGGKLGGIEPGATVGAVIGGPNANVKNPDGTLYVPVTTDYDDIRQSVEQDITDALNDAKAGLQTEISGVRTDVSNARGEIVTVRGEVATAVSGLTVSIADAKKAGTDAAADAKKASDDLALEVSRAKGAEGTITTNLVTVKQTADNAKTAITDEITARTNADTALGNRATSLETTVNHPTTGLVATNTKITDEVTARSNADTALGTRASNLETTVNHPTTGVAATNTKITDEVTARSSADTALGNRSTALETTVNHPSTGVAATNTKISDEVTARSNADTALGTRATNLETTVNNPTMGVAATFAKIGTEETTRSNADSALSTRATNLETSVNNGATGNLALQGKISDEATTRSNADSALATRATTLEARSSGGGNLVVNTDFLSSTANVVADGWGTVVAIPTPPTFTKNAAGDSWHPTGEDTIAIYQAGQAGVANYTGYQSNTFAVAANGYLQAYCYMASHRCQTELIVYWTDQNGTVINATSSGLSPVGDNGGQSLNSYRQQGIAAMQVPSNAFGAFLELRKYNTLAGQGDSYAWFVRPFAAVTRAGTTEFAPFSPGSAKASTKAVTARISTEETTRANADTALATRATNLETTVNNPTTGAAATYSKISTEETTRSNADSALATRASNLETTVNHGTTGVAATYAKINTEETVRSNADAALATRANTLESKMEGNAASGLQTLIKNNRKNLIDTGWWKKGASIPWTTNGGRQNVIYSFPDGFNDGLAAPDGSSGDVWLCQADASGGPGGGWQSSLIAPLDPDKTYRFTLPIAQISTRGSRTAYWGTDGICVLNTTTPQENPYFAVLANFTPNRWHLFVGYIFPRNSTSKTHAGAGIWDMVTGEKVGDGLNYCFRPDGTQPLHRAYQYYAYENSYQAFGRPMVELVDGTETPFPATLAAAKGVTAANARINDEQTTRANADSALATRANTIEAQFRGEQASTIRSMIYDETTARANADSALATRSSTIEARYNMVSTGVATNDRFANWPDGQRNPTGWIDWTAEGVYTIARTGGFGGSPYSAYTQNNAGYSCGFYQGCSTWAGKWVVEVTARRDGGSLSGAGVTLSGIYNLDFLSDPDTKGAIRDSVDGETRTWVKTFDINEGALNLHAMHGWLGFGRSIASHYITWFKLTLRPAGPGDIAGVKNSADIVSANARIGNEETARANGDSAIAGRTSVVEAQVSNDSMNLLRNGTFNAPGWGPRGQPAYPPYWNGWVNDNNAFIGPANRDSRYGATAPLQIDRAGIQNGVMQNMNNLGPGWYVLEADITGEDGNWSGSGIHCNFNNGYAFNYGFAVNGDTAGRYGDIGTANRQFSYMFYNGADSGTASFYLMAGWSGFQGGTNFGFFRYVCHRVVFRPATAGEIAARKVEDSNIIARVSSTESTVANINGKTQAYFSKTASVPGAEAFIVAQAINDSGQATSSVAIGGNSIALYNNADGSTRRAMYLAGGNATFDGFITARSGIRIGDGQWSIAVAPKDFGVSNGQAVSYGYDLGRIATVTFGACPVALNAGEVYRAYATNNTSTGFTAVCEIVSAPSSSNQSVGPGYSVNGAQAFDVGKGSPDATNGIYNFAVTGTIQAYAYNDGGGVNCVHIDSWLTDDLQAGDAQVGDPIMVLTEHRETWEPALVERSYVAESYCVRITTSSGIKLTLSEDTPITLRDGREIWVREVLNEDVAVLDDGAFRWEPVLNIEEIGVQPVARLSCWSGTYAAGDKKGRMIFTHNIINKQ